MERTIGAEVNPAPLLLIILNVVSSPENGQGGPFLFSGTVFCNITVSKKTGIRIPVFV